MLYFACLGAGYIMVEVGLIAHFVMALGNPTISASVLITGMLVFSGLGALTSERILPYMRAVMPAMFLVIGGLLLCYALFVNLALDDVAALPYGERLVLCFLLIAPPAFLMGFPMPTAMTTLGRLGKDHMFIWAWGVNGSFSVIGAAAAPVIATNFGLGAVIEIAAFAYLLALPAFFGVIAVDKSVADSPDAAADKPDNGHDAVARAQHNDFATPRRRSRAGSAIIKFPKFSRVYQSRCNAARERAQFPRWRRQVGAGSVAGGAKPRGVVSEIDLAVRIKPLRLNTLFVYENWAPRGPSATLGAAESGCLMARLVP